MDIGLDEYLYGDGLCLIEWPENIDPLLPDDCLRVRIEVINDQSRRLCFE
jgi:tRNA threonylcarbamoyladenosine biosynthesis protein TsaE